MRCVSWDEFLIASESFLDEAIRLGTPLYVRRAGVIVLEILPTDEEEEAALETKGPSVGWYQEQLASDPI